MVRFRNFKRFFIAALLTMAFVSAGGYAPAAECDAFGKVIKEIAPEAELAAYSCEFKNFDGTKSLHVKVTVKNVSDKPQRFRVNLFFDNGKGVGGLLPRKTGKGLIEPGKEESFTYPVKGMDQPAKETTILINPIAQ